MTGAPHVLIVERSITLRRLLATRFSADGYSVATASGPVHALDVLRLSDPDVIVMDVHSADPWGFRARLLGDPQFVSSQVVVTKGPDLLERVAFWRSEEDASS